MSLNLAHGRAEGKHQALEKRATIEKNLGKVAEVLRRERPDLVALQEADGPSLWSGNFNHVEYLAREAEFPHHFRGEHVHAMKLSYGTALVSRLPLGDPISATFTPSPPTPSKGFVAATIAWPGKAGQKVQVVSLHLDFARDSVRAEQVKELVAKFKDRKDPLVVLGDFNASWDDKRSAVRAVAEGLNLRAYRPEAKDLASFPTLKTRIDWILVSEPLEFADYRVLPDAISDHRAVVVTLKWKGGGKPDHGG